MASIILIMNHVHMQLIAVNAGKSFSWLEETIAKVDSIVCNIMDIDLSLAINKSSVAKYFNLRR